MSLPARYALSRPVQTAVRMCQCVVPAYVAASPTRRPRGDNAEFAGETGTTGCLDFTEGLLCGGVYLARIVAFNARPAKTIVQTLTQATTGMVLIRYSTSQVLFAGVRQNGWGSALSADATLFATVRVRFSGSELFARQEVP